MILTRLGLSEEWILVQVSGLPAFGTHDSMHLADLSLSMWQVVLLALALGLALAFEFVNGFHDTANAVATVIYTHSLPAPVAVVWSGIWNFIGVLLSAGTVAYAIVELLPVDLVMHTGTSAGFAMVFALLASAIMWNLGTWYLGLPASSSHTLIGAILGVGIANVMMNHNVESGVNWGQARNVVLSLLVSPLIGFIGAALLLLLTKALVHRPELYRAPEGKKPPPWWIRLILVLTCTSVSYAHGSNDGQKGMGLIVVILIGVAPAAFALNMDVTAETMKQLSADTSQLALDFTTMANGAAMPDKKKEDVIADFLRDGTKPDGGTYAVLATEMTQINALLGTAATPRDIDGANRGSLRAKLFLSSSAIEKLIKTPDAFDTSEKLGVAKQFVGGSNLLVKHIALWVKAAVAIALGLGTMIGWKRIVVTLGEKIGKTHLTYAQGAVSELVTAVTISAATVYGLPVSTTHVLSSGIAGSMAANRSGLQARTLRNILLAWVLTLPVCVFLGALLFALALNVVLLFGVR